MQLQVATPKRRGGCGRSVLTGSGPTAGRPQGRSAAYRRGRASGDARCMSPLPGRTWPTLARELLTAREELSLLDTVVLAVRADRHRRGLSQRAYASDRGWSKSFVARLETRPGAIPFASVLEALDGTGTELVLRGPAPEEWPAAELLARDRAGRRLPAHYHARRLTLPHHWWQLRHPYGTPRREPDWTAEPNWGVMLRG